MTLIRMFQEILPYKLRLSLWEKALVRKATARHESFHCRALGGESDYNITINSDMTVSCNCQDFDGSGHIGDLNCHSLTQIFSGSIACKFRELLAERKFPTPTCVHCSEFSLMPTEKTRDSQARYHVPTKGIQVENTAHCNLRCHMCNREQLLRLRSGRQSLSLCDVEKIAHLLKEYGLKDLHYYNLGEPFLSPDIHEQIKIIRQHNPDIRIITLTNGQLLKGSDKTKAALSMDYIGISLDGVNQDTVSKYQVGGNFETAYQNMANLVLERKRHNLKGPIIEWIYVLFRWNDHPRYIAKAIELAKKADVDVIGFYRGDVKLVDRSLRWYYHPYFKTLGNRTRNSIIVNLHNIPSHLLFK